MTYLKHGVARLKRTPLKYTALAALVIALAALGLTDLGYYAITGLPILAMP